MVLKEKISSGWQFCWWKWPIDVRGQRRMAKLDWADSKATVTQITTCYNQCIKMSISVAPWSRCATAAEDHIGWHFCQLRTESWGSSSCGLIKFGRRLGKRSLVWWHSDGRVRFWCELHGSVLPCNKVSGCWWWSNGMGDIFFEPLITNRALFKCHSLSEYYCWPSPSL